MLDVSVLGKYAFCPRAVFFCSEDEYKRVELARRLFLSECQNTTSNLNMPGVNDSNQLFRFFNEQRQRKNRLGASWFAGEKVISDSVGLCGTPDLFEVKDKWQPVILTTGSPPKTGIWEGQKLKLGAYIMIISESKSCNSGQVWYVLDGHKRSLKINTFMEHKIRNTVDEISTLIKKEALPDIQISRKCKSCPHRRECHEM